jgi:hypothetical protein
MKLADLTYRETLAIAAALPEDEQAVYAALVGCAYDAESAARHCFRTTGPKWCMLDNADKPIVACGGILQRPHVYQTWFLATHAAWTEHGAAVTNLSAELIRVMLADGGAHRIETVTLASRSKARRWYDRIGLRYESTMPGYGARGQTFVTYAATRNLESI